MLNTIKTKYLKNKITVVLIRELYFFESLQYVHKFKLNIPNILKYIFDAKLMLVWVKKKEEAIHNLFGLR